MFRWTSVFAGAALAAGPASADVWRVTYELTGSQLQIESPIFNQDILIGPGAVVLEFSDNNGQLVDGPARLVQYSMIQEFSSGIEGSLVVTDIDSDAAFTPETPFVAGTLANGTLTLGATVPYRAVGVNTCTGALCFFAGFENGVPTQINRTDPVTFAPIVFSGSPATGDGFTMNRALVPGNESADSFLVLQGTEVRRVLVQDSASDPCPNYPAIGAHTADTDCDGAFGLDEVLRIVQLYNAGRFRCAAGAEDAYSTGQGNVIDCVRHDADFQSPAFAISLSELLRVLQLYSLGGAEPCGEGEDGFCQPSE